MVCHTLGPLLVRIDNGDPPPELLWRKNIGLLIYLARAPSGGLPRDHLVSTFWSTKPPRNGRQSLREALRVVRRHLGPDRLLTDAKQVVLADAAVGLDLIPFDRHVRAERWDQAEQLVRGEFLEGFDIPDAPGFGAWLETERRRWRVRMLDALRSTARPLLDAGRADEAGRVIAKAFLVDPRTEDALGLAARFFTLLRTCDGVIRTRRAFNGYLEGIGVDPGRLPADMYDRLRRRAGAAC